jgi:hypothetical protein
MQHHRFLVDTHLHTFRRTYSTLLRATGAEFKVMQELMRHSTIRVALDTYTQAVTSGKRAAQTAWCRFSLGRREARSASEEALERHSGGSSSRALKGAVFGI